MTLMTAKIRRRQKTAADNFIFGCIVGGNCLLPPIIARAAVWYYPFSFKLWREMVDYKFETFCLKEIC